MWCAASAPRPGIVPVPRRSECGTQEIRNEPKRFFLISWVPHPGSSLGHIPHAAKTQVGGAAVRRVVRAGVRAVAVAVARVAQVAPAAHDAAFARRRAGGMFARRAAVVAGVEPVPAPFPDIAGHLVEAEAIGP